MFTVVLGVNAQRRMQGWEGNTYMQFFTTDVDSVTFLQLPNGILQECKEIHDTIVQMSTVHDTIILTIRDTITAIIKDTVYIHDSPDTGFDEPLSGVFSISANKQVRFSRGNLQYTQSTDTWSFAPNQYDMIGTNNIEGGVEQVDSIYGMGFYYKDGNALSDKIDLLEWSSITEQQKGNIRTYNNDECSDDFVDWGKNIGDGETWYTLTITEWKYLLHTRINADSLLGIAHIILSSDGTEFVNGLIILPDNWTCPADITFKPGFNKEYCEYCGCNLAVCVQAYLHQTFTLTEWQKLEKAGAVFLPASGLRNKSHVSYVQDYGLYWTCKNGYWDAMGFRSGAEGHYFTDFYTQKAVRLVQDVK